MIKKQFWENPYQTSHLSTVATVNGSDITLDSTIFFAFSGGQESDHGTIAGYSVISARKNGTEIVYTLQEDHELQSGQVVQTEIDWVRRHRLMRLHFAAELVLEIVYQSLHGVEKVGAHIAQDKARIDFAWPESVSSLLPAFTTEANRIIADDLAITCAFEDEQNERRYWEITGFSRVHCGGTHVKSTGEIGPIKFKRNNIGRGKERIEIYLGA